MTTSIASNQTTIVDVIQKGSESSSRTKNDRADGDSFSQVLKDPVLDKNTRLEKNPSKSNNKELNNSRNGGPEIVKPSKENRQKLDVEPVDRGVLDVVENDETTLESTAETLLALVNVDGELQPSVFTNNLLVAEEAVLVPNKATKVAKGGNILPVIEPILPNSTHSARITAELSTQQLLPQGLKDVVLIQPVLETVGKESQTEKTAIVPLPLVELATKQKQFSDNDFANDHDEIKRKPFQKGSELDFSKLGLADFINKESKLITPAILNRTTVVESATELRAETSQLSTVASNAVSNSNSTNIQKTDTGLLTLMMQTTYKPGSREWSESFSRNIAMMALNNNKSAEIRMDPPDLGSIQVKISQLNNETNLQFQVQHSDTKQAIEASIQRLKESLAEQGFVNINVDIQQGEQSQSQADRAAQKSGLQSNGSSIDAENVEGEIAILQPVTESGIDFFA